MIKKLITYTDFEGNKITEPFYFNLTKFEWLELETYTKGGLIENLKHALETNNNKKTIDIFRKLIMKAYGEKNEDTGKFYKNDNMAIEFSKSEAFSELFYEIAYDEIKSKEFFTSLIPQELRVNG